MEPTMQDAATYIDKDGNRNGLQSRMRNAIVFALRNDVRVGFSREDPLCSIDDYHFLRLRNFGKSSLYWLRKWQSEHPKHMIRTVNPTVHPDERLRDNIVTMLEEVRNLAGRWIKALGSKK